jgi:hypothetical protein
MGAETGESVGVDVADILMIGFKAGAEMIYERRKQ